LLLSETITSAINMWAHAKMSVLHGGDPRHPEVGCHTTGAPERDARWFQALDEDPDAIHIAVTSVKAQIIEAAAANKRGFVYAVQRNGRLIESALHPAEELIGESGPLPRWAELAKDKEFVRYVQTQNPKLHIAAYVSTSDKGTFLATVVLVAGLAGRGVEELHAIAKAASTAAPPADWSKICNNGFCGARDVKLSMCSRCHNAWYCSRECQVKTWPMHKKHCAAAKKKPAAAAAPPTGTGAHDWEGEMMSFSDGPMLKFKCTLCDRTCVDMGDGSNMEFQKQLSIDDCPGRRVQL
jgi:hypothetical protein